MLDKIFDVKDMSKNQIRTVEPGLNHYPKQYPKI